METKRAVSPQAEALLGRYFPVLDHGFVSLRDYMGSDETVERAARVSYQDGTTPVHSHSHFLSNLMRWGHMSPFEHVELVFHCQMPIFVARQWVRHRTASISELSGRYSVMPPLFYAPTNDRVQQAAAVDLSDGQLGVMQTKLRSSKVSRQCDYRWMLGHRVSRELARIDLPLRAYTNWVWKIDARNLFHALELRCSPEAQWELRQYFRIVGGLLKSVLPVSFQAWLEHVWGGVKLSKTEAQAVKELAKTGDKSLLSEAQWEHVKKKLSGREPVDFDLRVEDSLAQPPKEQEFGWER